MLTVIYPSLCSISTARNLIAVLIVGCSGLLSKPAHAAQEVFTGTKALVSSSNIEGSSPYAIANIVSKVDGAHGDAGSSAECQRLEKLGLLYGEAGLGRELASYLRTLTAIGKVLEAGHFSINSIAKTLGWRYDGEPQNRYSEARIEQFVNAAGKMFASRAVLAWGLSNAAIIYKAQGRSKEAISLLESALAIASESPGPDSYRLGVIANRLALYCAGVGRTEAAEDYFRQAISAFEKSGDLSRALEAGALHNLAIFYGRERRYREETEAALQSLSLLTEDPIQDQSRVFDVLSTLGGAYHAQGRYKDAELVVLRAFAIAHEDFKPIDPRLSHVSANLGVIYKAEGRAFEATAMFSLALKAAEIAVGPEDIWTGMVANRLAVTHLEQGKLAEAEILFKRAIAVGESGAGEDSLFLAAALFNLSALYARQARYAEAEALLKRSLIIRLHRYGPSHPAVEEVQKAIVAVQGAQQEGTRSTHKRSLVFPRS